MPKVLLVDVDAGALHAMAGPLEAAGFEPTAVSVVKAALKLVETRLYQVVGCSFEADEGQGLEFLAKAAQAAPGIGLMLVATSDQVRATKEARDLRDTAQSRPPTEHRVPGLRVVLKPFEPEQLVAVVQHLARMAEMRRSTSAMASVVAGDEDSPVSSAVASRSVFPRKV